MASSAENSSSFTVPPFLSPALFPLCNAASPGGCRLLGSVIAHLHPAGWCSGDWYRPIINLPYHLCPLGFSSFLFFNLPFFNFMFLLFLFLNLCFQLFKIYFLIFQFLIFSFLSLSSLLSCSLSLLLGSFSSEYALL